MIRAAILAAVFLTSCVPFCEIDPCMDYRRGEWKRYVPPAPQHEHVFDKKGRCTFTYTYRDWTAKERKARCATMASDGIAGS